MLMKGKVCVVTGAASPHGIGRSTANLLASNGADVVVLDVSEKVEEAASELAASHPDRSFLGVRCDISSSEACATAAAEVAKTFPSVDALVHCAGLIRSGRYDEISDSDFATIKATLDA